MDTSRPRLGPRLKSYLSSGNLFGLGHTTEIEQKAEKEATWPDLDPVFDETTTTGNARLDMWITALRHRLWEHADVPLGTKYNAPLLWMTEQCINVSKENKRLKEELQEMNIKYQELLKTRPRASNSLHRPSNSVPGLVSPLWMGSQSCTTPTKHHQNDVHLAKLLEQGDVEIRPESSETSAIPRESQFTDAMNETSSTRPEKLYDGLSDEDKQFATYELSSSPTGAQPINEKWEEYSLDIEENTTGSTTNLEESGAGSLGHSVSYQELPSIAGKGEAQVADHRRRKSSASIQVPRRAFSFYPGDDDVLVSLAEYSKQQRKSVNAHKSSSTIHPAGSCQDIKNDDNHVKDRGPISLTRDSSESSVVAVVKAQKQKKAEVKIPTKKIAESSGHDKLKDAGQRDRSADRVQSPLAAALAATARFGKTAKKTIRTVPPDV